MAHQIFNAERIILVILSSSEKSPVSSLRTGSDSPYVFVCDHAGWQVPSSLEGLGVTEADLKRHIGWDIGALGVARRLSNILDAPLVWQNYSRLVIDCNRVLGHPALIAVESDATTIPGNMYITKDCIRNRIHEVYQPYHRAIKKLIDARESRGLHTIVVSIHSFTPIFRGIKRACELGVLFGSDSRYAQHFIGRAKAKLDFLVMANEPYRVDEKDCTIPMHAITRGNLNVLLEIRQDLIVSDAQQELWGNSLARVLEDATSQLLRSRYN
ncbi:MAG: N-formylglutamate amidohydrolase [Pseudohongiellaceae bacterium]